MHRDGSNQDYPLRSSRLMSFRAKDGGAEGSRTPDLLIANETLYQLSYDPIHQSVRELRTKWANAIPQTWRLLCFGSMLAARRFRTLCESASNAMRQTAICNQFVVHGWWVNTPVILPTIGALIRERMHSNVPILYRRSGVPQKHVKSV